MSAAKPVLNTLSSSRQRTLPKSFDFGGLTLNLERAAARAAKGNNEGLKRQFEPNRTSRLLDRLASKSPEERSTTTSPVSLRARRNRTEKQVPTLDEGSNDKINNTRNRFISKLPNPLNRETSSRVPRPEYIREVSSLDKLAAQSGVDSATNTLRKPRTYKDRLQVRPQEAGEQAHTRFALPRKGTGAPTRARRATTGQSDERRQSRAQEMDTARLAAIQARKQAARPAPQPYDFAGLESAEFSPVLSRLANNGSRAAYKELRALSQDDRDAVRLVVGNRSIVEKKTVLRKIETWIPEGTTAGQSESRL